jgi:adenosylhomocysteine nucleosidase
MEVDIMPGATVRKASRFGRRAARGFWLALALAALRPGHAVECAPADPAPRTAVISAFAPEWRALQALVSQEAECDINGVTFVTGRIEGQPVVMFMSGISMVNAAMTSQLVIDRFNVERLVLSGVAGGADPGLGIGDVVVPQRWGEYLEAGFARETPQGLKPFDYGQSPIFRNFGMIFPNGVLIGNAAEPKRYRFWFDVDPQMLAAARNAAARARLKRCAAPDHCLAHAPRVVVGGSGVSGTAFVDNAEFRRYVFSTFEARVMDMESASLAHVAYANRKPFIAFRSLSDLAGGGDSGNQMLTFMDLASENSAELLRAFLLSLPAPATP